MYKSAKVTSDEIISTVISQLRDHLDSSGVVDPDRRKKIVEDLKSSRSLTDILSVARREMGDEALGTVMKPLLPEIRSGFYRPNSFNDPSYRQPSLDESRGRRAVELAEAYSYLTGAPIADLREVSKGRRLDPKKGDKPSGIPVEVPRGSELDFSREGTARYSPYTSSGYLPDGGPVVRGIGYDDASRGANMGPEFPQPAEVGLPAPKAVEEYNRQLAEYKYGPGYAVRMGDLYTDGGRDVPTDVRALHRKQVDANYDYERQKHRDGGNAILTGLSSLFFPVATAAALAGKPLVTGEDVGIDSIGDAALATALAASKIPIAHKGKKLLAMGATTAAGGGAAYAYNKDKIDRQIDTLRGLTTDASSALETVGDLGQIRAVLSNPEQYVRKHGLEATRRMLDSIPKDSQRQVSQALGLDPEKPISSYVPNIDYSAVEGGTTDASKPDTKDTTPTLGEDIGAEALQYASGHAPLLQRLGGTAIRALPVPGARAMGSAIRTTGFAQAGKAIPDPSFKPESRKPIGDYVDTGMRRARIVGRMLPTTSPPSPSATFDTDLVDPVKRTAGKVTHLARKHNLLPSAPSAPSAPSTPRVASTPSKPSTPRAATTPSTPKSDFSKASGYIGVTRQLLSSEGRHRLSAASTGSL